MPTYEYMCSAGHRFERVQRMSDAPLSECPECGAVAERQLSAGGGFLFKGSGFYITDYRSESYRKAAAAESGGGDAAKSETAPTSKDAPKADGAPKAEKADAPKKTDSSPKKETGGGSSSSKSD
jgi:putative FmdB family regulatory protein